jgi:hypothetical protein
MENGDIPSGSSSAAGFSPRILSSSDWTREMSGSVYDTWDQVNVLGR